jgi:p-cumate 2,3-dioxygenase beta subunit
MNKVLLDDIGQFLYYEAELLDSWQLDEWLGLFLPESHYYVPSLSNPELDGKQSLYLIMDDFPRLSSRVGQFSGGHVWAENPPSQVRRLVTNVRLVSEENDELTVHANFSVHRYYQERADIYVGQYRYKLVKSADGFAIREKTAVLAMDVLRPQGKLSIIL